MLASLTQAVFRERKTPDQAKDGANHTLTANAISVVVPVYNSADDISDLVARLEPILKASCDAFEVILVNDGSRDGSWQAIGEVVQQAPFVRGLDLLRNYGQHNALLAGIQAARHEVIVTMDDDLQHPPEEIPRLVEELAKGYDVVYGTPQNPRHGLWRGLALPGVV